MSTSPEASNRGSRASKPGSGVARKRKAGLHHVQLTADRAFRAALEDQAARERWATGEQIHPAMMVPDALFKIEDRAGDEMAALISDLDLSARSRAGAVRVRSTDWTKALYLVSRFHRSTNYRATPIKWTPRLVIIAALYCYATQH